MTDPFQPPDSGAQSPAPGGQPWAPAGQFPGQPGGVQDYPAPGYGQAPQGGAHGYYQQGAGFPVPAQPPRRRYRAGLIIGIVVAAVVVLGVVLALVVMRTPKGSIALPGTLLGVSQGTGPGAKAIDRQLTHSLAASAKGKLLHPVAAVYGDPSGAAFAVAGAGICGTCAPKSVADAKRGVGFAGVQSFPSGPKGGVLLCAPAPQGAGGFYCWWFDQKTGGYVAYVGGFASSNADAAAKTNQIRAAVEH